MEKIATNKFEKGIYIFLALTTLILFLPTRNFDFIDYDDPWYVKDNQHVKPGFSWDGIVWAFADLNGDGQTYWHPVTWLSHMLDCQLFGPDPGAIHVINALLHTVNALLLFNVLLRLTGAPWRSVIVATVFAWHPLQIGTVAWIAERKNILGTLFALVAIQFYISYTRSTPTHRNRWLRYGLSLLFFALSLMSKPILITLPCVFLLLDYWPLRKYQSNNQHLSRVILEKIPFFILSIVSGLIMIKVHEEMALIATSDQLPLSLRVTNAFVSYWSYVRKVFWPSDLSFFYPLPEKISVSLITLGILLVSLCSLLAVVWLKKRPYIFVGWFWYLGTIVPFIGLMQVNDQAMADRFIYVPIIGFLIFLVWSIDELLSRFSKKTLIATICVGVIGIFTFIGNMMELGYWRNGESLFARALELDPRNTVALNNYGIILANRGENDEALKYFSESTKVKPDNASAQFNLGLTLSKKGRHDEAAEALLAALKHQPNNPTARAALGTVYMQQKKYEDAAREFTETTRLRPDKPEAFYFLGSVRESQSNPEQAIAAYLAAVKIKPDYYDAHLRLGVLLSKAGKSHEALPHFQKLLEIHADSAELHYRIGNLFSDLNKRDEAIRHYQEALRLQPDYPEAKEKLRQLGAP